MKSNKTGITSLILGANMKENEKQILLVINNFF